MKKSLMETSFFVQCLLDCDYLLQYEVGKTIFLLSFLYGKPHVISQCHCHWCIPVDIPSHFNKIVEQYNNLKQIEKITCKNVFLLLLHHMTLPLVHFNGYHKLFLKKLMSSIMI